MPRRILFAPSASVETVAAEEGLAHHCAQVRRGDKGARLRARVEILLLLRAVLPVGHVAMEIDQAGHQGLAGGVDSRAARRMLHLPVTGPIAWIAGDAASALDEAVAAVQAVWPKLAE